TASVRETRIGAYPNGPPARRASARARGRPLAICTNPLPHAPAADRILVVRLGALGDVVRTLPAASALRAAYPGAHLAWLVEPASRGVVEMQPWIDEVLVFPRGALSEALRRGRPGRFA